ncbi:hypothetical protein SAMN04488044_2046 [Cognatishimia maritima]|uniref:Uncharacterized protein n=1 Tax=Cognatishimia maritima TaxID=870908 RepID=A0A1M5QM53_9RHOB|nr:hypothetical protein SAMN04488044_2046 [Cognatishimia maritima]
MSWWEVTKNYMQKIAQYVKYLKYLHRMKNNAYCIRGAILGAKGSRQDVKNSRSGK